MLGQEDAGASADLVLPLAELPQGRGVVVIGHGVGVVQQPHAVAFESIAEFGVFPAVPLEVFVEDVFQLLQHPPWHGDIRRVEAVELPRPRMFHQREPELCAVVVDELHEGRGAEVPVPADLSDDGDVATRIVPAMKVQMLLQEIARGDDIVSEEEQQRFLGEGNSIVSGRGLELVPLLRTGNPEPRSPAILGEFLLRRVRRAIVDDDDLEAVPIQRLRFQRVQHP